MTGGRILIKKMWVKFDGMDIECMCDEHNRKCDKKCKEYVVKFTEIKRVLIDVNLKKLEAGLIKDEKLLKKATKDLQKQTNELKKSIKKFKVR